MYYTVYLTKNLVNSKIYVGVHKTENLNDGYLGSGLTLQNAIKKYGKSKFTKQILFYCYDEIQMKEFEKSIVDSHFVSRKDTYNLALGGTGGDTANTKGKTFEEIYGLKRSLAFRKELSLHRKNQVNKPGKKPIAFKVTNSVNEIFLLNSRTELELFCNEHNLSFVNMRKQVNKGKIILTVPPGLNKKSSIIKIQNTCGWSIETISK